MPVVCSLENQIQVTLDRVTAFWTGPLLTQSHDDAKQTETPDVISPHWFCLVDYQALDAYSKAFPSLL